MNYESNVEPNQTNTDVSITELEREREGTVLDDFTLHITSQTNWFHNNRGGVF